MEYLTMTSKEIKTIINKGGDDKRKLNEVVSDFLDGLYKDLSEEARATIADTDINIMAETFGGLKSAQEVNDFISNEY